MVDQNTDVLEHPATTTAGGRRRPTPEQALEFSSGRVRDVAALRGLGFSYREIASHYGVTPQAISILLSRCRRQMKAIGGAPGLANLSTRAATALRRLGIQSREDAAVGDALDKLTYARNCGRKTLEEIERWMSDNSAHHP